LCVRGLFVSRGAALLEVLAVRRALEFAVRVHARFDLVELRLERLLRRFLHIEVERRVDAQALLVQVAAEPRLEERRPEPLDEVRRNVAVTGAARRQDERIRLPEFGVFGAQESLIAHQVEHGIAAQHRAVGMGARVVIPRRLGERRERRGLGDVQVAGRLPKKHLRRGFYAENVRSQADLIEIELEDLVLGEVALQLHGNLRASFFSRPRRSGKTLRASCIVIVEKPWV